MSHPPQPLDPTLPPAAGGAAETLAPPAEAAPPAAGAEAPPGYELLRELGRGGMGVVYLARDTRLNRPVALKMILAGAHATPASLVRFLAEAEAVAALTHPGIVAIYEIGRHAGLPYFTLEYCPGGSLAEKVKDAPLPPREAAAVVEEVARAVAHAHGQGIVHRDLKPENILLSAEFGVRNAESGSELRTPHSEFRTPKVTDFGLAKRLEVESGMTATGAVMGTPSYMAPEQAEGKKEVGPAADIYALGAILYRLLGGRPPFQAATPLDTMLQVVGEEPVPLRQLNRQVPRDLETITHKCLAKGPAKRYASAEALADDLRRWLNDEPIQARPVGRVERGLKWVKRHPAGAGFITALLVGVALSTTLAIQAELNARRARQNEDAANRNATELAKVNTELTRRGDELAKSRENLMESAARGLLRPLRDDPGPLTQPEIEALADLASERDDALRLRFVHEAVGNSMTLGRLRNRGAVALHAAVGLDERRRGGVEELLARHLQEAPPPWRVEGAAVLLTELGGLRPAARRAAGRGLIDAFARVNDHNAVRPLAERLATLVAPCDAEEAAELVAAMARALAANPGFSAQAELERQFKSVVPRLSQRQAAVVAGEIAAALRTEKAPRPQLAEWLAAASERMAPAEAVALLTTAAPADKGGVARPQQRVAAASDRVDAILARARERAMMALGPQEAAAVRARARAELRAAVRSRQALHRVRELLPVADLEAPEARQLAAEIAQAIVAENEAKRLELLADPLLALLAPLPPSPEGAVLAPVVARVVRLLDDEGALLRHVILLSGLSQLSRWLGPAEVRSLADALMRAANRYTPIDKGLSFRATLLTWTWTYSRQLEGGEGAALRARLIPEFVRECAANPDGMTQKLTWRVLTTTLTAADRDLLAAEFAEVFARTADDAKARALAEYLVDVSNGMAAGQGANFLTGVLGAARQPDARRQLADHLIKVAAKLPPGEAAPRLAEAVIAAGDDRTQFVLARALVAVTRRLGPAEAIDHLLGGLRPAAGTEPPWWARLAGGTPGPPAAGPNSRGLLLTALSEPTLTADLPRVLRAVHRFLDVIEITEFSLDGMEVIDCLPEGLKRLDRAEAAELFIRRLQQGRNAAALMVNVGGLLWATHGMDAARAANFLNRVVAAFELAAKRMQGNAAVAQISPIMRAVVRGDRPDKGLPLPGRFDKLPAEEKPVNPAALVSQLERKTDPDLAELLIEQTAVRVAKLPPPERAAYYAQALGKLKNPTAFAPLAEHLKAEAPGLSAKGAAELLQLLGPLVPATTDPGRQRQLFEALAAVATRLAPEDAPHALLAWLAQVTDQQVITTLVTALRNSLTLIELQARTRRCVAAAGLPGGFPTLADILGKAASLRSVAEPLPCPLDPPELVELLKHPLCVGPARRVVLDRLGDRYGRTFADQWEFVRFAKEQKLGLDLTSPPKLK